MSLKSFAAAVVAATIVCAPLTAYAHHGRKHPPQQTKKMKKTKPPQKAGVDIRLVSQAATR